MYDKRTFLLYVEQDLSEVQFPSLTEYSLNCLSVFCFGLEGDFNIMISG